MVALFVAVCFYWPNCPFKMFPIKSTCSKPQRVSSCFERLFWRIHFF